VSSVAKAYSFQAKMRQKIAVANDSGRGWGRTTSGRPAGACIRRPTPPLVLAGDLVDEPLSSQTASDTLTAV